jgi:Na+/H+ antiporter NhaA
LALESAKFGILLASLIAGVAGMVVLLAVTTGKRTANAS